MKVTHTFELYDPKKHSVRARCTSARDMADLYIPNKIIKELGLDLGKNIYVTYSSEQPIEQVEEAVLRGEK
jgi:phosphoribosylamine-glycine ligase